MNTNNLSQRVSLWPLVNKELLSILNSTIAYGLIIIFLLLTSVMFFYINDFFGQNISDFRGYFGLFPIFYIILIPAFTMRSWAEEKRQGTFELLLSLPLSEWQLVLAKYISMLIILTCTIVLTFFVPLLVMPLGYFEVSVIVMQYFGVFLLGAAGLAIGLYISSCTSNQIMAFLFTMLSLLLLVMVGFIQTSGFFAQIIKWFFFMAHFDSFTKGILDSRDVLYFVMIIIVFLYLNKQSLILQKWR